ncbi:MAG: SDR family oxidoreductase [Deltaproteobacteria bacterium]|nr:SDR family oxidoreductase [Deltaproteobacteria bacterium]MBW2361341.1 SDR family oxidoreductase [Deltaproteobacteria bacterium]
MGTFALTGGATGIGAALKEQLVGAGHSVTVVDIKQADIVADLSTQEGRRAAVEGLRARAPEGLDGFVPLAGIGAHVTPASLITRVNYFGVIACVEGVRDLLERRQGSVVLISSNSGPGLGRHSEYLELLLAGDESGACELIDRVGSTVAYAGAKLGLARWMRRHAGEYVKAGVRMNAVAPGVTNTPMVEGAFEDPGTKEAMHAYVARMPMARVADPTEVANVIRFLLGPEASFVCGSLLFVDGGQDASERPDEP